MQRLETIFNVCIRDDSEVLIGRWRICWIVKIHPYKGGKVRKVKVTNVPPANLSEASKYDKGISLIVERACHDRH